MLTAEVGEGHAAAARALAAELVRERDDVEVIVCDALVGLGRALQYVLLDAYRWQLRSFPWIFGVLYGLLGRLRVLRALGSAGLAVLGARPMRALIECHQPDVVVSTYPAATSVLGHLRRRGRVRVPTCATATDLAGLEFWAHPGVDLHLVMDPSCIAPVERVAGAGSARCVRPLVPATFFAPCPRERVRRELDLPAGSPLVLVSGGGWGVGDVAGAVRGCLELPRARVVCLAGRNEELWAELSDAFSGDERVRVLRFTDRMNELLAAADALVHSTGGVTCLEALVRGCPIVAYGAPPGHARKTARVMESLGLLESAESPSELVAAVGRAVSQPVSERPRLAAAPSAGSLVLGAQARRRPSPTRRVRLVRPVTMAAAMFFLAGSLFVWDGSYPVVARAFDLDPMTSVATDRPEVALVMRTPEGQVRDLVGTLERRRARASFAFTVAPSEATLRALAAAGDQPLAELGPGKLIRWLDTKDELKNDMRALHVGDHGVYLASRGLTLGQYLLARQIGDKPVTGSVRVGSNVRAARRLDPGDIVVATLSPETVRATAELDRLLAEIARQGLKPVSLSTLLAAKR